MNTHAILIVVGMVLEESQRKYRVVFIDRHNLKTWLIDLDDDDWAFPRGSDLLKTGIDQGEIKLVEDPYGVPSVPDEKSKSYLLQAKRFELIKPFVHDIRKLLIRHDRRLIIASIPVSRQSATTYLKLFLKRGMNQQALRPGYWNCGHPKGSSNITIVSGITKRNFKPTAKKVGAPRTIAQGVGINVNEDVRKKLLIGADLWLSARTVTLRRAIDLVVKTYYSQMELTQSGEEIYTVEKGLKPTERQLQYFIKTEYPEEYIRRKRHGTKYYELNERALLGWADDSVQGPGDQFQVDASVANVPLVSQFDRRRIVGYPIIYFIVDVFSRLITGVSVGFEGPSWAGAMMSLINMVTSKVEFCKTFGIAITEDQWPTHHAPKCILADRGELMSVRLGQDIISNLGIDILNVTARRPDLKSLVERRFGIIKAEFGAFIPGFVKDKFLLAKQIKDFRLKATLNLLEFMQLVIRAVLVHNITPIRDYRPPAGMVTEGLPPAPLDLWNWGIENRSGLLHQLTIEKTMVNVMHRDEARVTEKGIRYKGIFYWSPSCIKHEWFARARRQEWNVTIAMTPHNMENILLLDSRVPHGFEVCKQINTITRIPSASLFEIEELEIANKKNIAAAINDRQSERITHESASSKILESAIKAKRQLQSMERPSKSKSSKNIRAARALEKAALREKNSILATLGIDTKSPDSQAKEVPYDTPHEQYIASRLREESMARKRERTNSNESS
ncbi:Mu transposase C-terminal domain-containing protein [Geomonas edaphica]|uniref:Mu transposase C-terminal domain-containing protein n=1 Tax=Geomonas edaphica TaxID=2570226 RepID=UPI0010A7C668|nr:DDE-type integrase/transposase/recombinase [Geomonas edaphica]